MSLSRYPQIERSMNIDDTRVMRTYLPISLTIMLTCLWRLVEIGTRLDYVLRKKYWVIGKHMGSISEAGFRTNRLKEIFVVLP
jgi:hypothetical protein